MKNVMKCLKCETPIPFSATYDVGESGWGSIDCPGCQQQYDCDLVGGKISFPLSLKVRLAIWLVIVLGVVICSFLRS